ncbi:MAG TPA: hypothetical protein VEL11_05410 [Candidatus Bathyarchaeia archaeon]|nr:hypothetical protein [Candidatus Bathyarchaeia archaeon]
MMIQDYVSAEAAAGSRMPGFSLYENTTHNVSMRYPSNWNKQEILLNNDHSVLQVMFALPIAARFSKAENSITISEKIRDIIYNQSSAAVVLNLRELPIDETPLQAVTNDRIHMLGICFDNVNILENSYDHKMVSYSKLIYTYTDPLQNHLKKQGMQIISVTNHKEISITYNSRTQDFDRFLPTVNRMIGTLSIGVSIEAGTARIPLS